MGKAYRIPSALDRLRKQQIQIKEMQALNRNRNTPRPEASTAFAGISAAGSQGGTGNFLRTAGDTMIGPLALAPPVDFSVEIDADGIIDIGESSSNSQYTSNIQFEDIQPNTFTLDTIAGAAFDGQILVLRTFAPSSPITIAQATLANGGNIQTPNDADFNMGDLQMISLIFDASLLVFANTGGTWRVLTGDATGGGGGLTEPVIFGINTLTPQTLPTTTTIAWNTKNPHHITLDRAVEFDFTNLPADGSYEGILIIIDIPVGGFDSPIWPASLENPPIIPTTPDSRFSVLLYTINGGTVVTHATSTGSSTGGVQNLSGLVIDVNKDWLAQGISNIGALTGVTGITATGSSVVISGIDTYDFFQAGQSIQNKADPDGGLLYNVADLQAHIFRADTDEIARFEESAAGVFRLNMLDHSIRDSQDITFNDASGATVFAGTSPAIGFDSVEARLLINMPTGANLFITNNNVIGTTQINNNSLAANIVSPNDVLQLGVDATVVSIVGEFRNDGTDVNVFSGGAIRNLSNITATASANVNLSNLVSPTSINQNLIPQAAITLGDSGNPWSNLTSNKISLGTAGTFAASDNAIIADALTGMELNTPAGDLYSFHFGLTKRIEFNTSELKFISGGQFEGAGFILTDAGFPPIVTGELRRDGDAVIWEAPTFQVQRTTTGTFFGDFNLTKVDAAPSGGEPIYKINFNLFDSPTSITYAQIRAEIRDVTDAGRLYLSVRADNSSSLVDAIEIIGDDNNALSFMNINARISSDLVFGVESGSTDLKIFPQVNSLGITMNNTAYTVGSLGTLTPPATTSALPATAALIDGLVGDKFGAMLLFDNGVDGMTLLMRQSNGAYGALFLTRDQIT